MRRWTTVRALSSKHGRRSPEYKLSPEAKALLQESQEALEERLRSRKIPEADGLPPMIRELLLRRQKPVSGSHHSENPIILPIQTPAETEIQKPVVEDRKEIIRKRMIDSKPITRMGRQLVRKHHAKNPAIPPTRTPAGTEIQKPITENQKEIIRKRMRNSRPITKMGRQLIRKHKSMDVKSKGRALALENWRQSYLDKPLAPSRLHSPLTDFQGTSESVGDIFEEQENEGDANKGSVAHSISGLSSRSPAAAPEATTLGEVENVKLATFEIQGRSYTFDPMFLRDACSCSLCRDTSSKQKNFETIQIPDDIEAATITPHIKGFLVTWNNDIEGFPLAHESFYSYQFIEMQDSLHTRMYTSHSIHRRRLWDLKIYKGESDWCNAIDYEKFLSDKRELKKALEKVDRYGLVFLKNVAPSNSALKRIANRIGPVRNTFYGEYWDVRSVQDAKNVAYTSKFLDLHMDLLYMPNPPGMQILHCRQPCAIGGTSLFSDAFYAFERLKEAAPKLAFAFANFPVTYGYINDGQWYQHAHPSVDWELGQRVGMLPYPGPGRNFEESGSLYNAINWSPPFQLAFDRNIGDRGNGLNKAPRFRSYYAGAKLFKSFAEDEKALIRYDMQEGDCVLFDNRRILHGRTAFEGERWFRGTYIDTDVWRSRLRVLREETKMSDTHFGLSLSEINRQHVRPLSLEDDSIEDDSASKNFSPEARLSHLESTFPNLRCGDESEQNEKTQIQPVPSKENAAIGQPQDHSRKEEVTLPKKECPVRRIEIKPRKPTLSTNEFGEIQLNKKQRIQARKEAKKARLRELKESRAEKEQAKEDKIQAAKQRNHEMQLANETRWRAEERLSYLDPEAWDQLPEETKLYKIRARQQAEEKQLWTRTTREETEKAIQEAKAKLEARQKEEEKIASEVERKDWETFIGNTMNIGRKKLPEKLEKVVGKVKTEIMHERHIALMKEKNRPPKAAPPSEEEWQLEDEVNSLLTRTQTSRIASRVAALDGRKKRDLAGSFRIRTQN